MHIEMWHGWTMEIFMTIGIIVLGTVLYKLHGRARILNTTIFKRFTLNNLYDGDCAFSKRRQIADLNLHDRFVASLCDLYLCVFIAVLGGGLLLVDHIGFDMTDYAPMSFYEAVAILGLVIPVIVLPFVRTRLMAIILTGARVIW